MCFQDPLDIFPELIIHRVIKIQDDEIASGSGSEDVKTFRYLTKGDANPDADPDWVPEDRVIGVVWFRIPYLGLIRTWVQDALFGKT